MSSQIEDYKEIRPYIIEVLHFLRQEAKVEAYYAGEKYDPDTTFRLQTYLETQIDLKELRQADHLFLIHPGRVASSSLVEVGYALGQRKTCHIFTKNRKDLPFLLRNLRQPNVFFHEYNDIKEILELIRQIISQSEYRNQGL
jgi:nucleoside 2-deoxyribosyltransferase